MQLEGFINEAFLDYFYNGINTVLETCVLHAVLQCMSLLQTGKVALQKSHSSKLQDHNK